MTFSTELIATGIPGVQLAPGDHICVFYANEQERDKILLPFLREGLEAGDKCICVIDHTDPESLLASLGADLGTRWDRHQLDILRSRDTYLSGGGFSTKAMLDFWDRSVGDAITGGFRFTRSVGEMTWATRQMPGVEGLVEYEARLNDFLPRYPQVILCLYQLDRFGGEVLVDVLKTHPKVMLGEVVLDNPYYLEPGEYLATWRDHGASNI
ncbi:MEDS domain-containing protein [Mycobacterium sp. SM1]|uniref:MEDS domain-containing protein n=1 Tax=Mycobacterium sp. SM1 TaxID=2816243 RepID=UPI001BCEFB9A|nr:MEDS domain-containing protein [Mycobacterium sp. SM1]MBS4728721.1 MEDS domain-containing protein [Mycobacterium sp. SM1]